MDFNTVKFGNVYLTQDGLFDGQPCRVAVSGLDSLKGIKLGSTVTAADGTPYNFVVPNTGQGVILEIRPFVITGAVLASINDVLDLAMFNSTTIDVEIEGETGDFDVNAMPLFPKPLEFSGEFSDDNIYDVVIRVIVMSMN